MSSCFSARSSSYVCLSSCPVLLFCLVLLFSCPLLSSSLLVLLSFSLVFLSFCPLVCPSARLPVWSVTPSSKFPLCFLYLVLNPFHERLETDAHLSPRTSTLSCSTYHFLLVLYTSSLTHYHIVREDFQRSKMRNMNLVITASIFFFLIPLNLLTDLCSPYPVPFTHFLLFCPVPLPIFSYFIPSHFLFFDPVPFTHFLLYYPFPFTHSLLPHPVPLTLSLSAIPAPLTLSFAFSRPADPLSFTASPPSCFCLALSYHLPYSYLTLSTHIHQPHPVVVLCFS